MSAILVIMCNKCGRLLLAKTKQKTRTCPYCGSKVDPNKARKIASAKTAQEASAMLQRLKKNAVEKQKARQPWQP